MPKKKIDYCNNESVLDGILLCLAIPRPPVPPIPARIQLLSKNKPGLSKSKTTAAIISKLSDAGIVNSSPEEEKKIGIIVGEIFDAIAVDAKVSCALEPGTPIQANGASAAGPVSVFGTTIAPGVVWGSMS